MAGLRWSYPGSNIGLPKGHGEREQDGHAYSLDGDVVYEQRWENGQVVMRWVGPGGPELIYPRLNSKGNSVNGAFYAAAGKDGGHWQTKGQRLYDNASGTPPQPDIEEQPTTPEPTPQPQQPSDSMQWLIDETLWSREDVEEILGTLETRRPQIILAGPPGTGKTWVAERFARFIAGDREDAVRVVQFHPSYAYEDFVEGLRPVARDGQVAFEVIAGALVQVADFAREVDYPVVLVIDEINRANLPSVFGELLYLLEYRNKEIQLLHRDSFSLPKNLYVIGTMNTADRSIRSVDAALRRRFDIFDCPPSADILDAHYDGRGNVSQVAGLSAGMRKLNDLLTQHIDHHHTIGHTFLMAKDFTQIELRRTWQRQIRPLIDEYFFDQPDLVDQFTLEAFWPGQSGR